MNNARTHKNFGEPSATLPFACLAAASEQAMMIHEESAPSVQPAARVSATTPLVPMLSWVSAATSSRLVAVPSPPSSPVVAA
ncbi:UNVERIFIED_CONTAM: hypothetical protein Sindi_1661300 [Sesamum indicum]